MGADPQKPQAPPQCRRTLTLFSVGVREIPNWNRWQVFSGAGERELGLLGGQASNTGMVKEKVSLLKKKKKKLLMAMQFPARAPSLRNSEDPFQTGMRPGRMLVF